VTDLPFSNGIWYDVGNVDGVFVDNWVQGVGITERGASGRQSWSGEAGFFFEISKGAICAGNVFVNCDLGIHILNSSNVRIYNNTLVNSTASIERNERSAVGDHFGWHPATGPDVDKREGHVFINNLMYGDAAFNRPLLAVWQPGTLCGKLKKPQFSAFDNNVFFVSPAKRTSPLIMWSPADNENCFVALGSPGELNKLHPEFAAKSVLYKDISVFRSPELGNYQLLPSFKGKSAAAALPLDIKVLLNRPKKDDPYIGAYPQKE
jgi:parallel beta-helix repeat protein